ncbi:hypothetical protein HN933_01085 [Candidatus Woesearchaeota archaeon]|nr:hypothetical protein [Candidatus Woesearchaeota archaeon]MBT7105425.1 hypothetical protein [Candidatus Woesearchaeota archaeon]
MTWLKHRKNGNNGLVKMLLRLATGKKGSPFDPHVHLSSMDVEDVRWADRMSAARACRKRLGLSYMALTEHNMAPRYNGQPTVQGVEISSLFGHMIGLFLDPNDISNFLDDYSFFEKPLSRPHPIDVLEFYSEHNAIVNLPHPCAYGGLLFSRTEGLVPNVKREDKLRAYIDQLPKKRPYLFEDWGLEGKIHLELTSGNRAFTSDNARAVLNVARNLDPFALFAGSDCHSSKTFGLSGIYVFECNGQGTLKDAIVQGDYVTYRIKPQRNGYRISIAQPDASSVTKYKWFRKPQADGKQFKELGEVSAQGILISSSTLQPSQRL